MRHPTHADYSRRLGPVFAEQAAKEAQHALIRGLNGTTAKDYKPAHGGYPSVPARQPSH